MDGVMTSILIAANMVCTRLKHLKYLNQSSTKHKLVTCDFEGDCTEHACLYVCVHTCKIGEGVGWS